MERGKFKKPRKSRNKPQACMMYFPYTEALLPFQPAALKRKIQAHKSRPQAYHSDSESDEDVISIPRRIDLAAKLRNILDEEEERLEEDLGLPSLSIQSRSSSVHSSNSPKRRIPIDPPYTISQFIKDPRQRHISRRSSQSSGKNDCQTSEEMCDRTGPRPMKEAARTEPLNFPSIHPVKSVINEGLRAVPDSNTHSSPAIALIDIPLQEGKREGSDLTECESVNCLPAKPKSVQVRVRKQKPARAVTKSPTNPAPERRIMTAIPCETRPKPGPPAVAEKQVDSQYREEMLDVLLKNKSSQDHSTMMSEYCKRTGLADHTRVFIINSQDDYIRRALKRKGWYENKVPTSHAFHLKWTYSDSEPDYRSLRPGQFFNHFQNNRRLTTKYGLSNCFRGNTEYGLDPEGFYPRTYDLGDAVQVEELKADYERTAALGVVKQHAEYFLSLSQRSEPLSLINTSCLQTALHYSQQRISDYTDKCELPSKYSFIQTFKSPAVTPKDDFKYLLEYSKFRLPFKELSEEIRLKTTRRSEISTAWKIPSAGLISKCIAIHSEIMATWPQATMEGSRNVWIVKPGQNARGSGVHCLNDLAEIVECGSKLQARIVQKYVERPLLLEVGRGKVKFDIRQWVLVTSFEPLEIHFFNSCYLRLCSQPFTLDDLKDKFSHLANYSIQKTQAKSQDDTVWSLGQFLVYLSQHRPDISWKTDVLPQIHNLVISTLLCASDEIEPRAGSFELYGFDIILDESLHPWLLEVNLSPACAERTPWLTTMLDEMSDGLFRIVLDGNRTEASLPIDTNQWQMIYRGVSSPVEVKETPPCSLEIIGEKANIKKEKLLEKRLIRDQAGQFIQKIAKGFLVRNRNKHKKQQKAAVKIQSEIRKFLAKCELNRRKEISAVNLIQTIFRSFYSKEVILDKRKVRIVTILQNAFRRKKAIKKVTEMKICRNASILENFWRMKMMKFILNSKRFYRKKVIKIQRFWKKRFFYVNKKAEKIQTRWRVVLAKKKAEKIRVLVNKMHNLQLVFRMFLAKQVIIDTKITRNALSIQSLFRRFDSRQIYIMTEKCRAALFILRQYRSYKARKVYLRLRRAKAARIRAAIRIQATIKAHAVRLDYKKRKSIKMALNVQKLFRGHLCKVYFKAIKRRNEAAKVIQRCFREYYRRKRGEIVRRMRVQEKERQRRKEQIRKEVQARGIAASDRLSQRPTDALITRQSPVSCQALQKEGVSTLGSVQKELGFRKMSAKPGSRVEVTPPPQARPLTFDGMELLSRPGKKSRVKPGSQEGKRPVRY